jgi:hypothetical protein
MLATRPDVKAQAQTIMSSRVLQDGEKKSQIRELLKKLRESMAGITPSTMEGVAGILETGGVAEEVADLKRTSSSNTSPIPPTNDSLPP